MVVIALQAGSFGGNAETWRSRRAGGVRLDLRKLMAIMVTIAFLVGVGICGPAEHAALESEPSVAAQSVEAGPSAPTLIKSDGQQKLPLKKAFGACTGHCSAHGVTLPATLPPETVAFTDRAVWRSEQDYGLRVDRPVFLDRPPRA